MEFALILHEDVPSTLISLLKQVLGTSKSFPLDQFDGNFQSCAYAVVLVRPRNGTVRLETAEWINQYAEPLGACKTGLICLEGNNFGARETLFAASEQWKNLFCFYDSIQLPGNLNKKRIPGKLAQRLIQWKRMLKDGSDMPETDLMKQVEAILRAHNTCTLCTGFGGHVRATPLEYIYAGGSLYFLTEGGEKLANIAVNPHVSIAVYKEFTGMGELESVQIEGTAKLVEAFSPEYVDVITQKGYSEANLKAMPLTLNMLKVEPTRFEILKSDLRKSGHNTKQTFQKPI